MRKLPTLKYNGLTLILSKPSRFDKENLVRKNSDFLISATGGTLFNSYCLQPDFNTMQCDIRTMDDESDLISGTKCVMLFGEEAMHKYCISTRNNSLNEMRGSLLNSYWNIPAIASFPPQEAADIKNYEGEDDDDDNDTEEGKSHGATKRGNYDFWLKRDTWKAKQILKGNFQIEKEPRYFIYPSADDVINLLTRTKNELMFFDIETDYEEQNLLCFSFSFTGEDVYSVPVLNENYQWAYSSIPFILRALAIGMRDNIVVGHNICGFDLIVMAMKYKIAARRAIDTMLMMNRCFPDIEKSLMHCVSYWTWQNFHKDEDSRSYTTSNHVMDKLKYCGKDVFTTYLIYKAMMKYADGMIGLHDSFRSANDSIIPYVTTMIQGIRYDENIVAETIAENDLLMEQYIRIINLLIGSIGMQEIGSFVKSKKKGAFPGSNKQCVAYFHNILDYPIVFRSKETQQPSLGKKSLFKLALKHSDNPVITFTLLYRILKKETGALKFNPWDGRTNVKEEVDEIEEAHELIERYSNV